MQRSGRRCDSSYVTRWGLTGLRGLLGLCGSDIPGAFCPAGDLLLPGTVELLVSMQRQQLASASQRHLPGDCTPSG